MALGIKRINGYRDYMACVRNWEYYDESEKEQLRQWNKTSTQKIKRRREKDTESTIILI